MPTIADACRKLVLCLIATCAYWHVDAVAQSPVGTASPDRFVDLFRPFQTDVAALSPNGDLLAYSLREGTRLYVIIVEVENPTKARAKVLVATDETSSAPLKQNAGEKTLARIHHLGWATNDRLVIETNANSTVKSSSNSDEAIIINTPGRIFAVDADGAHGRIIASPIDVAKRARSDLLSSVKIDEFTTTRPDEESVGEMKDRILEEKKQRGLDTIPEEFRENSVYLESYTHSENQQPRSPLFFDYGADNADTILLRTADPRDYQLFTANVYTGKLEYGALEKSTDDLSILINRQGRAGAAISGTGVTAFPRAYLVEKQSGLGRWRQIDAIAKTDRSFILSPENYFAERSFPVGFDENPEILYYASNVGRDTYGVYALDLRTGNKTERTIESPSFDLVDPAPFGFPSPSPLVFDRYTRQLAGIRYRRDTHTAIWLRADLQQAQIALEAKFPGQSVDIVGWDRTAKRLLAHIRGPAASGGFYLLDVTTQRISEYASSAPWLTAVAGSSMTFSAPNPAGGTLSGILLLPGNAHQKPIPIVVLCAEEPWLRFPYEFQPEMSALAEMGFAVLQVNPRGAWGLGVKHRQGISDRYDELQVEDILSTIDMLCKSAPSLSSKNVAILGHDRGGYLAMRAVQLRPDRFRCAIGIDPTIDLKSWIAESRWSPRFFAEKEAARNPTSYRQGFEIDYEQAATLRGASDGGLTVKGMLLLREARADAERKAGLGSMANILTRGFFGPKLLERNSLLRQPDKITKPIFLLSYRAPGESTSQQYKNIKSFGHSVKIAGIPVEEMELSNDFINGLPEARAKIFRHIEDFLNLHIYPYNVDVKEPTVIDAAPDGPTSPAPSP